MFYLELEVIVRSQIEAVSTTIFTYKAHFTRVPRHSAFRLFKMSVVKDNREQQQT